jgi:hypothetical protein
LPLKWTERKGDIDAFCMMRSAPRATPPIGRVVTAADVASLAVHLMTSTALAGAR